MIESFLYCNGKSWEKILVKAPVEVNFKIYINNKFFISILATPFKLKYLLIGFLYSEGIINSLDDIKEFNINEKQFIANVFLENNYIELPERKTLASGFGKGTIFKTNGKKVSTNLKIEPEKIFSFVEDMYEKMEIYQISGGVHASALANTEELLMVAEDIGRHNTFDKILGEAILNKISTKDKIILTTGRISTEMLLKASNMGIPVCCTLKIPTENAINLGQQLGITLVGQIKDRKLITFTYPERLGYNC